ACEVDTECFRCAVGQQTATDDCENNANLEVVDTCVEDNCASACVPSNPLAICDSTWQLQQGAKAETCAECLTDTCCDHFKACPFNSLCAECFRGAKSGEE